jgi:hypothetical protein
MEGTVRVPNAKHDLLEKDCAVHILGVRHGTNTARISRIRKMRSSLHWIWPAIFQ